MDIVWGIVLVAVECTITTIIGLVINNAWKKRQKEKEELAELKEKQRIAEAKAHDEEVKKLVSSSIDTLKRDINAELTDFSKDISSELDDIDQELDSMKKAMQKDIRRSLRQDGDFMIKRGYASTQEKTEFDELYWAYHTLGKNGVVDNLHDQVMKLPTEPPEGDNH